MTVEQYTRERHRFDYQNSRAAEDRREEIEEEPVADCEKIVWPLRVIDTTKPLKLDDLPE
jgi:hypothetical protein